MRRTRLTFSLFLFGASAIWSQQAPAPSAPQAELPPITRDAHSTQADLSVPLCAKKFDDGPTTDGVVDAADKGVTPPKATHIVDARFSDEARHQKREGRITHFEAVLSLVVNTNGEPEDICLLQSAGYGLDAKAAEAAQQDRFAPATKEGKPVAVRIHIQVNFNLHNGLF